MLFRHRLLIAVLVVQPCVWAVFACSGGSSGSGTDGGGGDVACSPADADGGKPDGKQRRDASKDVAQDGREADGMKDAWPEPELSNLSVSPLTMVPAFSPSIHDYYVRCDAGTNMLAVTVTPAAGAAASLIQPMTTTSGMGTQMVTLAVEENQAIVAQAIECTSTAQYWVRCLPHDFPQISMDLHPEAGAPPPGYYLIGNQVLGLGPGYPMLLDGNGVPVWYVRQKSGAIVLDVDNVVPGAISFLPDPENPAPVEIHQLSPLSTTYLSPDPASFSRHELRPLKNGNYLVLGFVIVDGVDMTGLKVPLPDGGTRTLSGLGSLGNQTIWEVDPMSNIVWTWDGMSHTDVVKESVAPVVYPESDGGVLIDGLHANSIDFDPNDPTQQHILVSMRNLDAVMYIDRTTGNVIWKMGGTPYSKDNPIYIPLSKADAYHQQHDAHFLPGWSACNGGSGQISLFDDETAHPGPARGAVYDVVVGGGTDGGVPDCGAPAAPSAKLTWQYKGTTTSGATGSFRISADGSRVIGWGQGGQPGRVFTEVDVKGRDLLDFNFAAGNSSFRAIKVPLGAFDINVLRNTAGLAY